MAFYDIVMLVVVIGAVWFGFWKGLAWQVASLAAIILSYIVSINFREPVSQYISAEAPWNRIAAMLILFLGTSLVIWTIYGMVSKSLKKMELKGFDRQAGALLGAAKGAALCMVITMFSVSLLGEKAHHAIHNSQSGRYVVKGITKVSRIVPGELAEYLDPHFEKFHETIGHDGDVPLDQYPPHENPFNQYQTNQQNVQNPNNVPAYQGQWQTQPANQQGQFQTPQYQNQYGQGQAQTYQGSWNNGQQTGYQQQNNQQYGNQQFGNQQQQYGNQQQQQFNQQQQTNNQRQFNNGQYNGSVPNNAAGTGNSSNGWPDININSKDVFDAAAEALKHQANEAIQRTLGGQQQR